MRIEDISKYKNKLANLGVLLIALIVAIRIYNAQNAQLDQLRQKKETEIKKNEVLTNIGKLDKKLSVYKSLLNKKDKALFMNIISEVAGNSGVKIASIRPSQEQDFQDYIQYSFTLSLTSKDYHRLGRFISALENLPKGVYYEVGNMDISRVGQRQGAGADEYSLQAGVTVTTYFFKG